MKERHTDSPQAATESAFIEAVVDAAAAESDLGDFFEAVQTEQFNRHLRVLARYCDYTGLLFDRDATASQQAFIDGATLGLWVADKMAARANVDQSILYERLATNTAVPIEHRAVPDTPDAENHVAHQLHIARARLEKGCGLDTIDELVRLSDIPSEYYHDARAGMLIAIGEACFVIEAGDDEETLDSDPSVDESLPELSVDQEAEWRGLVASLEEDEASANEQPINKGEVAEDLWRFMKAGVRTDIQVAELAKAYQQTDQDLLGSFVYQSRMVEPRNEDYHPIDEEQRASSHFMSGAVLAMNALELEALNQGRFSADWQQHDPSDFPALGMYSELLLRGAYNIRGAIDHRAELFRQAEAFSPEVPDEYRRLLRRIIVEDGYDPQFGYVHEMGFAYAYGHLRNPLPNQKQS